MVKSIHTDYEAVYDDALNDVDAWSAILAGDREAFEFLFRKYYDDLYRYAEKFSGSPGMAEDHIQQLFLKIWRRRRNLAEVTSIKTYLWTSLRRSMIDTFRKREAENRYLDLYGKNRPRMQYTAEELIIRDEINTIQSAELKEAMDQLTSRECEVLYLKFYEGMSYDEIEQIMSVSYQASRNYVYRALQSLRAVLASGVTLGFLVIRYFLFLYV